MSNEKYPAPVNKLSYMRNGRYICGCGKSYKEDRYMRHHQRWECNKEPSFECPHCKYKAKRKNSLKSHMHRRHNDYDTIL